MLLLVTASQGLLTAGEPDAALRINAAQIIGTHNSFHVAPDAVAAGIIRVVVQQEADANPYSHKPLTDRLGRLGVRDSSEFAWVRTNTLET